MCFSYAILSSTSCLWCSWFGTPNPSFTEPKKKEKKICTTLLCMFSPEQNYTCANYFLHFPCRQCILSYGCCHVHKITLRHCHAAADALEVTPKIKIRNWSAWGISLFCKLYFSYLARCISHKITLQHYCWRTVSDTKDENGNFLVIKVLVFVFSVNCISQILQNVFLR